MPKKAFTLMELLIIIALIAIIATVVLILLNPWQQIAKAQDSRRKNDLATFRKVLEDYYNDKGCYPKPNEVCAIQAANRVIIPKWTLNAISAATSLRQLILPIFLLTWLAFPAILNTQPINIFIK